MKSFILIGAIFISFQSLAAGLVCVAKNTAPSVLQIKATVIGIIGLQNIEIVHTTNLGAVTLAKASYVIKDTTFNSKTFMGYTRFNFLGSDRISKYSLILPNEYFRPSISAFISYFFNEDRRSRSLEAMVCKHQ